MKTSLTALALALAAAAVQAQPAASASPDPDARPAPQPAAPATPPPVPPAPPAFVPPVPPAPPVPDVSALIAESGVATQILMSERVVKGAPYCAQAVHETVQPLADGNRIVHQQTSQMCRDAEGRTRQEVERQGRRLVYLRDPVSGENWLLEPDRKTARFLGGGRVDAEAQREYRDRMREYNDKMRDYNELLREYARKMRDWAREHGERVREAFASGESAPRAETPKPPSPPAAPRAPAAVVIAPGDTGQSVRMIRIEAPLGELAPMPPIPAAVAMRMEPLSGPSDRTPSEALPPREIDGLKVTGSRSASTIPAGKIGNEKPIVISREVWTSPDLKVTVSVQTKDPRTGEQNYQLRNIRRTEPDTALMQVPADFTKSGLPKPRTPKEGKDGKSGKEGKEG
ncbi:hypothetical protein [Mitsuaria sp. GD03876]|uniref:hypothetical protein n=1 Tax=Mitsuaria sp. GD03876 TaxID=2975399 RepID=UPI0024474543|nr:hypothetical protein [Mitsuaria sp. GD03876]MDH0867436.1 hypothetical protein [Mitsuaria sp. GD03876]